MITLALVLAILVGASDGPLERRGGAAPVCLSGNCPTAVRAAQAAPPSWQKQPGETCAEYDYRLHDMNNGELWAQHWCTRGPECNLVVGQPPRLKWPTRTLRSYFRGPFPNPAGHGCIPDEPVWLEGGPPPAPALIFRSSFETGDVSAWSSSRVR